MEKALCELLKNAFESINSHGIISVATSLGKNHINIIISDIGCGIAPEHLKKIFRPYFTVNKKNAQGLGLCLARSIIKSNRGDLDITSTLNEGTNVIVKLKV
jgi:signal transduction histidine kinase